MKSYIRCLSLDEPTYQCRQSMQLKQRFSNSFVDVHKDLSLSIRFDVHPTSTTDSAIYTYILGSRSSTRDDNFFYELLLPNTIVVSSVVKHK